MPFKLSRQVLVKFVIILESNYQTERLFDEIQNYILAYGELVTHGLHGDRANFSPTAEYEGNKHEQTSLWWKEAKEIEDQVTLNDIMDGTEKLIKHINKRPISTETKRNLV